MMVMWSLLANKRLLVFRGEIQDCDSACAWHASLQYRSTTSFYETRNCTFLRKEALAQGKIPWE